MPRALVVDDEPLIVLLASEELKEEGFEVEHAFDAEEALSIVGKNRDWNLLVTDIRMPGAIDGWELGRTVQALVPDVKVIYASGREDQIAELSDRERFMAKPYDIEDLRCALRNLGFHVGEREA